MHPMSSNHWQCHLAPSRFRDENAALRIYIHSTQDIALLNENHIAHYFTSLVMADVLQDARSHTS